MYVPHATSNTNVHSKQYANGARQASSSGMHYQDVDRGAWVGAQTTAPPQRKFLTPMQRWKAESAREHAYHGIQSFQYDSGRNDEGTPITKDQRSSVGYLAPRSK